MDFVHARPDGAQGRRAPCDRLPVRGRHLSDFECVLCGPVNHAAAVQIGEVLICWRCFIDLFVAGMNDDGREGCTCGTHEVVA